MDRDHDQNNRRERERDPPTQLPCPLHHLPGHHAHSHSHAHRDEPPDFGGESGSTSSRSSTPSPLHTGETETRSSSCSGRFRRAHRGRARAESTISILDSMERRTQRTYRYGIGLVCIGATLNWLGFAQGHGYVDPLRYLGVACVISGSFCVCMAMCRWLGKPVSSVASRRISRLQADDHGNGDVHVINVSVPMYMPSAHNNNDQVKPPDYDIVVSASGMEPPPYEEAIKLSPGSLPLPLPVPSASSPPPPPSSVVGAPVSRERATGAMLPDNNGNGNSCSNYFRRSTVPTSALYQNHSQHQHHGQRSIGQNLNDQGRDHKGKTIVSAPTNTSSLLCLANSNNANANLTNNNNNLPPPPPYKSTADFTYYDMPPVAVAATTTNHSSQTRRLSLESLRTAAAAATTTTTTTSKSTFIP